ncbi:kinase-like domain-containing protein [Rhizophagus clarus]|uniref:Kinase-like domain-containing protein n=1 Tax=Rhizophagus clarus TaxID=94130 RepID=A0A8H3QT22_9GLOM|nr:kinase-like domain-containing protein [Rhizophagus clarus]
MEEKPKNLWKDVDTSEYQLYVTVLTNKSEDADEKIVYIEDLEKRKEVYGICGECNEPGTGEYWCHPCNAKRFKDNFKNWTSGNKVIDEFIQQSQLDAVYYGKCLEWIPFENFQNITYIAEGGFGKIYSAEWSEGHIGYWNIENQKWYRYQLDKYVLKSLKNSSDICSDFLNEIKSHHQIYIEDAITLYGITQDPNTKEYMMKWNDEIKNIEGSDDDSDDSDNNEDNENSKDNEDSEGVKISQNSEIYSQVKECDEIRRKKFENKSNKDKSINIQTHPQAIYTSRLLNFKNLPKPVNSSDLSSFQFNSDAHHAIQSTLVSPLLAQFSELELNEFWQK